MLYGGVARRGPRLEDKGSTVLRVTTPANLDLALEGLVRKVLREQPKQEEIYNFAAEYFEALVEIRDRAEAPNATLRDICPNHTEAEASELIKMATSFVKPAHNIPLVGHDIEFRQLSDQDADKVNEHAEIDTSNEESSILESGKVEKDDEATTIEEHDHDIKLVEVGEEIQHDKGSTDHEEKQVEDNEATKAEVTEDVVAEPHETEEETHATEASEERKDEIVENSEHLEGVHNEDDADSAKIDDKEDITANTVEKEDSVHVETADDTNDLGAEILTDNVEDTKEQRATDGTTEETQADQSKEVKIDHDDVDRLDTKVDGDNDSMKDVVESAPSNENGEMDKIGDGISQEEVNAGSESVIEENSHPGNDMENADAQRGNAGDKQSTSENEIDDSNGLTDNNIHPSGDVENNESQDQEDSNNKNTQDGSTNDESRNESEESVILNKTENNKEELPGEQIESLKDETVKEENTEITTTDSGVSNEETADESALLIKNELADSSTADTTERDIIKEFIDREKEFSAMGNSTRSVEVAEVYDEKRDDPSLEATDSAETEGMKSQDTLINEESTEAPEDVISVTIVPASQTMLEREEDSVPEKDSKTELEASEATAEAVNERESTKNRIESEELKESVESENVDGNPKEGDERPTDSETKTESGEETNSNAADKQNDYFDYGKMAIVTGGSDDVQNDNISAVLNDNMKDQNLLPEDEQSGQIAEENPGTEENQDNNVAGELTSSDEPKENVDEVLIRSEDVNTEKHTDDLEASDNVEDDSDKPEIPDEPKDKDGSSPIIEEVLKQGENTSANSDPENKDLDGTTRSAEIEESASQIVNEVIEVAAESNGLTNEMLSENNSNQSKTTENVIPEVSDVPIVSNGQGSENTEDTVRNSAAEDPTEKKEEDIEEKSQKEDTSEIKEEEEAKNVGTEQTKDSSVIQDEEPAIETTGTVDVSDEVKHSDSDSGIPQKSEESNVESSSDTAEANNAQGTDEGTVEIKTDEPGEKSENSNSGEICDTQLAPEEINRSRSSKDTESLEEEPVQSPEIVTQVQSEKATNSEEDGRDDENDVVVPFQPSMGTIDENAEDQLSLNLRMLSAAVTIQRSFRKYLKMKRSSTDTEVEGSMDATNATNTGCEGTTSSNDSSLSSSATKIFNAPKKCLERSTTTIDGLGNQSFSETEKTPLSASRKSRSASRADIADSEVWGTIEQELESAAATIQHGFRNYKARKRLRREDAIQIHSEDSNGGTMKASRLLGTSEFHDIIVLDESPR